MLQKVIMERDEIEMSKDELQTWIREKVKKNKLISSDVLETYKLLQSVLEKREKQAAQILKLCESVSACEAIVEKQYSLLGWKYRDTDDDDDDDDDNIPGCGSTVSISPTINSPTPQLPKLQDRENLRRANYKDICLKRKPVVVLRRLSKFEISFFQSPTPVDPDSEVDSFSGSDMQWEPEYDSSDSDYSISSSNAGSNKRRRIDHEHKTRAKRQATPQANINSDAESEGTKTSTPQARAATDAKSNIPKSSSPKGSANTDAKGSATKTSLTQASANTDAKSTATKTSTPQASTNANAKINIPKSPGPKGSANSDAKGTATKTSTPQASANTDAKSNIPKSSGPKGSANTDAKGTATKTSTPQASTNAYAKIHILKTSSPKGSANTEAKGGATKTSTPQASTNANAKIHIPKTSSPKGSANTDAQSKTTKTLTPQASTNTDAKNNVPKTPKERATADAKSSLTKTPTAQTSASSGALSNATNNSTPQTSASTNGQSNAPKTSTPQTSATSNGQSIMMNASTSSIRSNGVIPWSVNKHKHPKTTPTVPKTEIEVNMNVLARRRPMSWQQGKITEIVTKEDGRVKYKVIFEDKGKSLVRAHHIAYEYRPKLDQLFVGARVVVQPDPAKSRFCPGILGELPSRKNRMRFLVFMDDHSPVYVGLLLLNLVCKPLKDPLDDIPDGHHKDFLRKYLNVWPYPPQTQYRVGQSLNAEINGVLQRCEVQVVDSSLIQVVATDQHKEWIYRGSTCLEHMSSMKGLLEGKTKEEEKKEEKKQK